MKKIFTLIGGALLASTLNVNATEAPAFTRADEGTAITVETKNANAYSTTLSKNEDGSWTVADFIQSGVPFSFKFNKLEAVGDKSGITITSNFKEEGEKDFLLDSEDKPIEGLLVNYQGKGAEITLLNPNVYNNLSYSYVKKYDVEKDGYEYKATFTVMATDENSTPYTLYVSFTFDDQSNDPSAASIVNVETAPAEYYNLQGVKVTDPSNGIYLRRQGNQTTKVIVK